MSSHQINSGLVAAFDDGEVAATRFGPTNVERQSAKHSASSQHLAAAPSLDTVPYEVIINIWTFIEEPRNLAQTSQYFLTISRDAYLRYRWLLGFPIYELMFRAISMRHLLSVDVLDMLLKGGVFPSRSLVQLLYIAKAYPALGHASITNWASSLPLNVYATILNEAVKLYGEEIICSPSELDEIRFNKFLDGGHLDHEVFEKHRYMPLPITAQELFRNGNGPASFATVRLLPSSAASTIRIERAIIAKPGLIPQLLANGYRFSSENALGLCRRAFSQARGSADELVKKLLSLRDFGAIQITPKVAGNVISSLRGELHASAGSVSYPSPAVAVTAYNALLQLSTHGKLDFDLTEVVVKLVEQFTRNAMDASMIALVETLDVDFPSVDVSGPFVQAMFIKAELLLLDDVDELSKLMGIHPVTRNDVLKASLLSTSKSVLPIHYARRCIPGFDLQDFLAELVPSILHQPYRGAMLHALDLAFESLGFREVLAEAVEKWSFHHSQIPPLQFHEESREGPVMVNPFPTIRSMLAYNWQEYNAEGENFEARASAYFSQWNEVREMYKKTADRRAVSRLPIGPHQCPGFTQFAPPPETLFGSSDAELDTSSPIGNDPSDVEFVSLTEAENEHAGLVKLRFYNLLGHVPRGDAYPSVAPALVKILGPNSKSADIVLAHSLINGHYELSEELLELGVSLTLEHFKILLRVGGELPSFLSREVTKSYFRATWESGLNEPDTELAELGQTFEAKRFDETPSYSRASEVWPRTIAVGIDYVDGMTRVELLDCLRQEPWDRIARKTNSAAQPLKPVAKTRELPAHSPVPSSSELAQRSNSEEAFYKVVTKDGAVFLGAEEREVHLTSAQLWLSHLQRLKLLDQKVYRAVESVWKTGYDGTERQFHQRALQEHLKAVVKMYQDAQSFTPSAEMLDLKELTQEICEVGGSTAAHEIQQLVQAKFHAEELRPTRRRGRAEPDWMRGSPSPPLQRLNLHRRSLLRALHVIRYNTERWWSRPDLTSEEELPEEEDSSDGSYTPQSSEDEASSDDSDDEASVGPARKRAKIDRPPQANPGTSVSLPSSRFSSSLSRSSGSSSSLKRKHRESEGNGEDSESSETYFQSTVDSGFYSALSVTTSKDARGYSDANPSTEVQRHPVYDHSNFDLAAFKRELAANPHVSRAELEDRMEDRLMSDEANALEEAYADDDQGYLTFSHGDLDYDGFAQFANGVAGANAVAEALVGNLY